MITRYSHPVVAELWSDPWTYASWLQIESMVLDAQRILGLIPEEETNELAQILHLHLVENLGPQQSDTIRHTEKNTTNHDVAAFVRWARGLVNDESGKWLHFGLTSSDLVDTTQAMRFRRLHPVFMDAMTDLMGALGRWTTNDQPMLGITHGQPGEPTSMRARAHGWLAEIEHPLQAVSRANKYMRLMKLSGPMGTFAHNPPELEAMIAVELGLTPQGPGATQILPRSPLALWASSCAALLAAFSKVASDLRLMALAGELFWPRAGTHVGSSAMPHKNNPIEAEQIRGLARMARGYAAMLEADPLWLERDISNSSVERIAVPDLWHTVLHAIKQMTWILENMELRPLIIQYGLANESNALWSHKVTLDAIRDGMSYEEARDYALNYDTESYDPAGDAGWFTRQYPGVEVK